MDWATFGLVWLAVLVALGIVGFLIGTMFLLDRFDAPAWVMIVVPIFLLCLGLSVVLGLVGF